MYTIDKYPLTLIDTQSLILPRGARILTVQPQHETPVMWALIDPEEPATEKYTIVMYGTGHPIGIDPGHYISTFQSYSGRYVFHVFTASVTPEGSLSS